MDDMADLATELRNDGALTSQKPANPALALIYADPQEAQYIANSVDALLTCVNTIPAELLVGPRVPTGGCLFPRYSRVMFSELRTTVLEESPLNFYPISQDTVFDNASSQKFRSWEDSMQQPLRVSGQKPGKRVDFFVQSLILGSSLASITLIVGFGILGQIAFKKLGVSKFGFVG